VIIHNAAIMGKRIPIESYPIQQFENVMRINLKAPFSITQQLLPLLRNANKPSLIFVSSDVGQKKPGLKTWGACAISKFGFEGLAWVLAEELEDKVRVNVINLGQISTGNSSSPC